MSRVLRILHLEDDPRDAELVAASLMTNGIECEIVRVDTGRGFEREVRAGGYDIIFSDFSLPGYDGSSALAFARRERPDVPFVLISGVVGEESAIASLLDGATDYVLKDGLSRLVPSLQRALRESENWRARRRAEEALLASEQRYRRLFEASQDGILLVEAATGQILDANPALRELLGFSMEQLLGHTVAELGICGTDPATLAAFDELRAREHVRHAGVRLTTSTGQLVNVEFVASVYILKEQRVIQINVRDISERQRFEVELRQSQKLEAVGRLAGGVAHDFNNMLMVINTSADMVLERLPTDDSLRPELTEIRKAGVRAARLTGQLLAFSRKQVMQLVVCSLNAIVRDLEQMLRRVLGEEIELSLRLKDDLGQVLVDPGQVEQVLLNLVVNSRDAMDHGGLVVIETDNHEISAVDAASRAGLVPGKYVMLSVSDSGCGMDESTSANMFEPFFTTKAPGKGTGLGLSTVYGIVKQSGGHIEAVSQVGKGTCFRIYLPMQQESTNAAANAQGARTIPMGMGESVLVVEDDASVLALVKKALGQAGYRVLAAPTGDEAWALIQKPDAPCIDLLLTDVNMPGMNGLELARKLLSRRPTTKVILMSGYPGDNIPHLEAGGPPLTLLGKPFSISDLLVRIRSLLVSRTEPCVR
jgi:PAS domain S-box-containing protein